VQSLFSDAIRRQRRADGLTPAQYQLVTAGRRALASTIEAGCLPGEVVALVAVAARRRVPDRTIAEELMTRHEFRDAEGALIAVLDLLEPKTPIAEMGMVEMAIDSAGRSIRLRVFPPAAREAIKAAA
jgi:hypothetical protein